MISYLPTCCVSSEVSKGMCEPVVNFMQSQLLIWALMNGLAMRYEESILNKLGFAHWGGGYGDPYSQPLHEWGFFMENQSENMTISKFTIWSCPVDKPRGQFFWYF